MEIVLALNLSKVIDSEKIKQFFINKMEETKVLVMSYFSFIPNDLDYGGKHKIEKRVYQEIPQNQNPLDAMRLAILSSSYVTEDDVNAEEFWTAKELEIQEKVYNNENDYIQFDVLSGLKVNGKFYVDLNQCTKAL